MNKILIYSDAHIHCHKGSLDRLDDCIKCLEWVFDTAREHGISTIIFAGDLFQDRQKIQVISYQKTFEVFEKNKDITSYLLLGNHDLAFDTRLDTSSVVPLRALPKVTIIDKSCCLNIHGRNIDFLPYTKNPKIEIENNFKSKSDLLFTHISLNGAYLNTYYKTMAEVSIEYEGDMIPVDVGLFEDWRHVYSGHFHGAQIIGNFEYIGSPMQLNFNEVFQKKHIIILNLDTLEPTYVENTFSPRHLIIKENEIDNYKIENNFVQIVAEDLNSSKILEIKNKIKNVVASLEFKEAKKEHKKIELKTDIEDAKKALSEGEIVEKFTELTQTSLNKEKLIFIGREIIKKATIN